MTHKRYRIKISGIEQSEAVQKHAFLLFWAWGVQGTDVSFCDMPFLYLDGGGYILYGDETGYSDEFEKSIGFKEITPEDFLKLTIADVLIKYN